MPYLHRLRTTFLNASGSFWGRMITTASPGTQQRFRETMDFFFQAVTQQAIDRETGVVPDLESYISLRRDTRSVFTR